MIESLWNSISGWMGDTLSSILESILHATIFKVCYYIERILCYIISILTQLFEVFAGLDRVNYEGKPDYLINIFFSNKAITNIYWGMATIGVILIFVFAIWAIIRKMADVNGKQQQSLGEIIGSAAKSFFIIISMTLIITIVVNFTNELMRQVNFIFTNAYYLDQPEERTFSEEEYAAMARVLSTVGNYSVVQTSSNRYNLNLCYNDIRSDMYYLQQQGVFEYSYYVTDKDGILTESWQSVLAQIAKAADLSLDAKVDIYNQGIAQSITYAMNYLQKNNNVTPLQSVRRKYISDGNIHLDRLVFLIGTTNAAKNKSFNVAPTMDDALRGPYYYNQGRSIYNIDHVDADFDIGFKTDYLVVWMLSMALIYDLVVILLNCITRIFNMLFLYIIAPPIIAVSPLDNGGKFKQWSIAFIVQSFSVFGTVIAMRLLTIFLPIVIGPQLVIFSGRPVLDAFAKFVLVFGAFEAAKKSTGLLTGILADSAGWQSIQAGDMSGTASQALGRVSGAVKSAAGAAKSVGGKVLGGAGAVAGFAATPLKNKISAPFKNAADKWRNLGTGSSKEHQQQKAIQDQISQNKAIQAYKDSHPEDAPFLQGGRQGGGGNGGGAPPDNQNNNNNNNNGNNPGGGPDNQGNQNNQGPDGGQGQQAVPPPLPSRYGGANEAPTVGGSGQKSLNNMRAGYGFDSGSVGGRGGGGGPALGGAGGGGGRGGPQGRSRSGSIGGNNGGPNNPGRGPQGPGGRGNSGPVSGNNNAIPSNSRGQFGGGSGSQGGYGGSGSQGGYGGSGSQGGYGGSGSQGGYGGSGSQGGYGGSGSQGGYGGSGSSNYSAPQQNYRAPQGNNNYSAPQSGNNNYSAPQGNNNYSAPQGNNNYSAPQQNYIAPQGHNYSVPQGGNNYSAPQGGGNNYSAPQDGGGRKAKNGPVDLPTNNRPKLD